MTFTKKRLLVLGAATAGTTTVNRLRRQLDVDDWESTVVDRDDIHPCQPHFLYLRFGSYAQRRLTWSQHAQLDDRGGPTSTSTFSRGRCLSPKRCRASSTGGWSSTSPTCRSTARWPRWSSHSSRSPRCATKGGATGWCWSSSSRCPDRFTRLVAGQRLASVLDERKILLEADFLGERFDNERRSLLCFDEREFPFDLQVITVPLNVGAEYVGRFVLSDELNQRQRLHRQDRQRLAAIHLTGRMPHIKESR